jgi:hypothetical protein
VLQPVDLVVDRVGELRLTGLLRGDRVRAGHAGGVGANLLAEHGEKQEQHDTKRAAERAEDRTASRARRPDHRAAPCHPPGQHTKPDRDDAERQGNNQHINPPLGVAKEKQADHAQQP